MQVLCGLPAEVVDPEGERTGEKLFSESGSDLNFHVLYKRLFRICVLEDRTSDISIHGLLRDTEQSQKLKLKTSEE